MFNLFKKQNDSRKIAEKAFKTKDPFKAVELYSDSIKFEKEKDRPDNNFLSELHLLRGEIYLKQGVATLSYSDFLQAIEFNPKNGIAHNDLGFWFTISHFNTPDYDKALKHIEKAVEYCPERLDFKMNRAIIKIKKGEKDIGRKELEQLIIDGYSEAKVAIEKFCK